MSFQTDALTAGNLRKYAARGLTAGELARIFGRSPDEIRIAAERHKVKLSLLSPKNTSTPTVSEEPEKMVRARWTKIIDPMKERLRAEIAAISIPPPP